MGFEWLGGDPSIERLRQLEGACGETSEELTKLQKSGAVNDAEYEELLHRLAAVAVWVRASLIHGRPLRPPEELDAPRDPDAPAAPEE